MKALLFVILAGLWITGYFIALLALGDMAAHYDSSSWPSPLGLGLIFLLTYTATIWLIDGLHHRIRRVD